MLQHKRTLAGILAATMMFSLTACGGGGATTDPGSDAAQDPNEAAADRKSTRLNSSHSRIADGGVCV